MKSTLLTLATVVLAMISPATAQIIYTGHWDISAHGHLHEDDDEMELEVELHNHDLPHGTEHGLTSPVFHFGFGNANGIGPAPKQNVTIGSGTNSINLSNVWVTAPNQTTASLLNQPFIGFSAEELLEDDGWSGDVTFTLTSLLYTGSGTGTGSGAGKLFLFEDDYLYWNTNQTLGVGENYGVFTVAAEQHGHGEFAFSDEGLYKLTIQVSGNYVATYEDNNTNNFFDKGDTILTTSSKSGTSTLDINVVPEPSSGVLLMAGLATLSAVRRRTRR
jgi:hypothetical protein